MKIPFKFASFCRSWKMPFLRKRSCMYEYYDEFDRPYYECTLCSYMTYDEGEFY